MAKRVGIISINLAAGTAQFNADIGKAKASVASFGTAAKAAGAAHAAASHTTVSGMQASSAAIRVMEGGMTNNLRAVERFVAGTLKLGPVLQAAFPLIGGLAFIGLMTKIGTEVYDFFKKMSEGPARVANAFRDLNAPLKLTNDELRVTNDRLANDIAKLEGKRQNTLATALDEARVAADNLADSLDKDIKSLNSFLKEENIDWLKGVLTNQTSTTWLKELMGGKTGYGGFNAAKDDIEDKGQAKIDAAAKRGDKPGQDAAVAELNAALKKLYTDTIALIQPKLDQARSLQAKHDAEGAFGKNSLWHGIPKDSGVEIEEMRGTLKNLLAGPELIDLTAKNTGLNTRKEADTAANANAKLERPLQDKLKSLDAQITEVAGKLAGAGKSEAMKELMKADADAVKAIEEVNKSLERQHTKLDAAGEAAIRLREKSIALVTAEADWKIKLASSINETADRISSQKMLTAAIGAGYEATKKANAETALMNLAKETYNDPQWMKDQAADVSQIRTGAGNEFEAKHGEQTAATLDRLSDQIALENKLASVQAQGAEAVRAATLAMKIEKIKQDNSAESAEKLIQAEKDLYAAERANATAKGLAGINEEIDATRRLTLAQIEGAEKVRQVELDLKYEKMKREGASPDEIGSAQTEDQLKRQQAITEEVLKTANADRDRLEALDKEEASLLKLVGSGADQLGLEIKLRDIENERLKIKADELLKQDNALDGVKAFFAEMEKTAETSSKIIADTLNSAFDQVSGNLAKLVTHQKTDFAQMFKSIGESMVKSSIKKAAQTGLAAFGHTALGKKLGLDFGSKKDGQSAPTALWVQLAGGQSATQPCGAFAHLPSMAPAAQGGAGQAAGAAAPSFFKSLLGAFFGGGSGGGGRTPDVSSRVSYARRGGGTFGGKHGC